MVALHILRTDRPTTFRQLSKVVEHSAPSFIPATEGTFEDSPSSSKADTYAELNRQLDKLDINSFIPAAIGFVRARQNHDNWQAKYDNRNDLLRASGLQITSTNSIHRSGP